MSLDAKAALEVLGGTPQLTIEQARRIALAAQGFGARQRPRGAVRTEHLRGVVNQVGFIQIDSVNVVARSHYLTFHARLGRYEPALLDALRDDPSGTPGGPVLVEYWAHEASLMNASTWPLFGFRMRRAADQSWRGMQEVAKRHPQLIQDVLRLLAEHGPMTARAVERAMAHQGVVDRASWGWNWSWVKHACEHLFWSGRVTSAGRTRQFERRYARAETTLPEVVWERGPYGRDPVPEAQAYDELVELAARAQGVATQGCLRDYPRLRPEQARPAIERLVAREVLVPIRVEGWRHPAYLHRDAVLPTRVVASALLSPFDSLIWLRKRTAALFGFDFRLEIYIPAAKRVHGYYVLPFLYGERLLARVDLKADRARGVLLARRVTWEPCARRARSTRASPALEAELGRLAAFLGLSSVELPADALPNPVQPPVNHVRR